MTMHLSYDSIPLQVGLEFKFVLTNLRLSSLTEYPSNATEDFI